MTVPFLDKDKFGAYIQNELSELRKFSEMRIHLTGNPYTDNSIMTVTALHDMYFNSDLKPLDIQLGHLIDVFAYGANRYENGRELAWMNNRAKATFMIFPNNPIIHPAYTKSKSTDPNRQPQESSGPSILAEHIYIYYLLEFLKELTQEGKGRYCTYCGSEKVFDFNSRELTVQKNIFNKEEKFPTGFSKSWYPLVGTISEAQAYHGYSEQPKICGLCLFLAHYLPIGSRLFKGKLLLFQTNDIEITYELTKRNVAEFIEKFSMGTPKIESPGKGQSKSALYIQLLEIFHDIASNKEQGVYEFRSNLMLWMFSNSNQGADSEVEQIPSTVLKNLHYIDSRWGSYLRKFLVMDEKSRFSFVEQMTKSEEYYGFYSAVGKELAPNDFFEFYQLHVLERSEDIINFYKITSNIVREKHSRKAIDSGLKEGSQFSIRQMVHSAILTGVENKLLDVGTVLRWITSEIPKSGYRPFNYYLHENAEYEVSQLTTNSIPEDFVPLEVISSSYLARAKSRGGFNSHSFLSSLNRERSSISFDILRRMADRTPGLGWKKLLGIRAQIQQLTRNKYLEHLSFRIIVIKRLLNSEFEELQLNLSEYSSVEELEDDSLLTDGLLHSIYQYLRIRSVDQNFSLNRAVNDLQRVLNESKRSFESFLFFLSEKGVEVDENDFKESQELSESYMGDPRPNFSWFFMRQQIINFLGQLTQIDSWLIQVEEEIEAM